MRTLRARLAPVAVERKGKICFARPYRFIYPLAQAFTFWASTSKVKGRNGINVPNGLRIILPSQIRRPSGCHDLYLGDGESRRHSCEYVQESNPGTKLHH